VRDRSDRRGTPDEAPLEDWARAEAIRVVLRLVDDMEETYVVRDLRPVLRRLTPGQRRLVRRVFDVAIESGPPPAHEATGP
jgi:hypothetical protein